MIRVITAGVCLLAGLSACGSSSYSDRLHSAVSDMAGAITSWNNSQQTGLAGTGNACAKAASGVISGAGSLQPQSAPKQFKAETLALHNAQTLARAGFKHCAQAASTLDYPLMAQAVKEIDGANRWIAQARKADR
jgi:hypothetical protein